MDKKELICSDCGQYESECKCQATPPTDEGLRDDVAKWLFTMKYRMPNQRFYHSWHDEILASPLTEKEYLNLANELLAIIADSNFKPVVKGAKGYHDVEEFYKD